MKCDCCTCAFEITVVESDDVLVQQENVIVFIYSTLVAYRTGYKHVTSRFPHYSAVLLLQNQQSMMPGVHGVSRRDYVGRTEKTYTPGVTSPPERRDRIAEPLLAGERRHAPLAREVGSSSHHEHGSSTPVDRSHGLGQAGGEMR